MRRLPAGVLKAVSTNHIPRMPFENVFCLFPDLLSSPSHGIPASILWVPWERNRHHTPLEQPGTHSPRPHPMGGITAGEFSFVLLCLGGGVALATSLYTLVCPHVYLFYAQMEYWNLFLGRLDFYSVSFLWVSAKSALS